jgi:hypothetical protein
MRSWVWRVKAIGQVSSTKLGGEGGEFFWFSCPEGAKTNQPRATPWVARKRNPASPERAKQGASRGLVTILLRPFRAGILDAVITQGGGPRLTPLRSALACHVRPLQGQRPSIRGRSSPVAVTRSASPCRLTVTTAMSRSTSGSCRTNRRHPRGFRRRGHPDTDRLPCAQSSMARTWSWRWPNCGGQDARAAGPVIFRTTSAPACAEK